MIARLRTGIYSSFRYMAIWLPIIAIAVYLAFQIHDTIILFGIWAIKNPSIYLPGWHTKTANGLSRFVWLVVGIVWLVGVTIFSEMLRDWLKSRDWRRPIRHVIFILAGLFICNGVFEFFLAM